jgi:branched-chain amino acid aminotransferase
MLNTVINFNGTLTDVLMPIATAYNRGLRYGDGLFETMYWDGHQIRNSDLHLDRLFQGLRVLQFDLSGGFTRNHIAGEVKRLCEHNVPGAKARIRLNIFREDGNTLLPVNNKPVFVIESVTLPEQIQVPLRLTVYDAETKSTGILSNLKTSNYLLNIMAIRFAKENGFDDALILNSGGKICEAGSSNIFVIQRGNLYTPALAEGCVAGTKRRELMETLPGIGFPVSEAEIQPDSLQEIEEAFLTNAIRGICPVKSINGRTYGNQQTEMIKRLLTKSME